MLKRFVQNLRVPLFICLMWLFLAVSIAECDSSLESAFRQNQFACVSGLWKKTQSELQLLRTELEANGQLQEIIDRIVRLKSEGVEESFSRPDVFVEMMFKRGASEVDINTMLPALHKDMLLNVANLIGKRVDVAEPDNSGDPSTEYIYTVYIVKTLANLGKLTPDTLYTVMNDETLSPSWRGAAAVFSFPSVYSYVRHDQLDVEKGYAEYKTLLTSSKTPETLKWVAVTPCADLLAFGYLDLYKEEGQQDDPELSEYDKMRSVPEFKEGPLAEHDKRVEDFVNIVVSMARQKTDVLDKEEKRRLGGSLSKLLRVRGKKTPGFEKIQQFADSLPEGEQLKRNLSTVLEKTLTE